MYQNRRFKYDIALWAIIIFFLSVTLLYGIKGIANNCFHATDFSIYQQAIYNIASSGNLNPYLSIRNLKIFNDHFDPILLLASPWTALFRYSPYSLIFFEFLFFLATILLIIKDQLIPKDLKIKTVFLIIMTKGILTGLQYPIHPSTWSIFPIYLFIRYFNTTSFLRLSFLSLFFMSFKEIFPLSIGLSSFIPLYKKQYKKFLILAILSSIVLVWVMFARKYFLGPVFNYNSMFTEDFDIIKKIISTNWKAILKVFSPFFIPLYWILEDSKNFKENFINSKITLSLTIFLPLFLIHLAANKIHFQYGTFLTAPLLFGIILNPTFQEKIKLKKNYLLIFLPFLLTAMGSHTKSFKMVFLNTHPKCIISKEKRKFSKSFKKAITSIPKKASILATGGVIPKVLRPQTRFFQAGLFSKRLSSYDYLALERNGSGDTFPYSKEEIEQVISNCKGEVILKNNFFYIIKNPIPKSCYHLLIRKDVQ